MAAHACSSFALRWHATWVFKVNKPGIQADKTLGFGKNFSKQSVFGSLEPFTVRKIGDFPHFLPALASNNPFIIKLVKMWPGGTLHVVVGTLKISLDRLQNKNKNENKKGIL